MNKEEILQELEIEIQNILAPYFIILDGRDDTQENMELIRISKNISRKVSENYVSKAEVKEKIEKGIGVLMSSSKVEEYEKDRMFNAGKGCGFNFGISILKKLLKELNI